MKEHTLNRRDVLTGTGLLAGQLLLGSLVGCSREEAKAPVPTPAPGASSADLPALGSVTANGVLQPARRVALSFGVGGSVESVEVDVGDQVHAGETLATLETVDLERAAAQAQITLDEAQLHLKRLQQPADEADVRRARHAVDQAAAAIETAQLNLEAVQDSTLLNESLEDAQEAFKFAQHGYEVRLSEYEENEIDYHFVHLAHEDYLDAKLDLDRVQQQADLLLEEAQNRLTSAQQSYQEAQDALALLLEGADELDIEAAQLDVARAQLALETAQVDLARATLTAPFAGVVSAVEIERGEVVASSQPTVELLDVSAWRVETRNVGELQIGQVEVGQEVRVRVNAFQGETLSGHVATISPVAVVQQGDTTYTLMIELAPTELNLRPGMTARVEIVTEER